MKKTHNKKKFIMLIVYILLIGLCAFVTIKGCTSNLTLKALTPPANWDYINNKNIVCNVDGVLTGTLDPNEYYYMNNGNDENGPASTPAFTIYDTYTGFEYDEIRMRRNEIRLRGYLYDSEDNFSDYYDRVIWQDDFIFEGMTPDTIRFENITQLKVENIALFSLNFMQNGPAEFLQLINTNFTYQNISINEIAIAQAGQNTVDIIDFTISSLTTQDAFIGLNIYVDLQIYQNTYQYEFENILNNYITFDYLYSQNDNISIIIDYIFGYSDKHLDLNYYVGENNYNFTLTFPANSPRPNSNLRGSITLNNIQNNLTDYITYKNNKISQESYNNGYREGKDDGYQDGYDDGKDDGYQDGYDDGASGEINTTWILSLMNTATSILNIEILPNIRIIYLVGAFIVLAFVRFVIGWLR